MNKASAFTCALLIGATTSLLGAQEPEAVQQESTAPETTAKLGRVVPFDAEQVVLEFERWSGSLRFEEVAKHGTMVEEGQVIARFDTRAMEQRVRETQQRLESMWTRNETAQGRADLADESAQRKLHDSELALQDAREADTNWREFELPHQSKSASMSATRIQHGIDDAADELAQLEAMYTEDELTDATEEIVLQRSRRNLARQQVSAKLAAAMRKFTAEVRWARTTRDSALRVERAEIALDNLRRSLEFDRTDRVIQAMEREQATQKLKNEWEELKADLEHFVIKAPRSGMLLHGGARQYHPDTKAPRFEKYADGYQRRPLFTIANPAGFGVVFHVAEDVFSKLDLEQAATAEIVTNPNVKVSGKISITPSSYAGYGTLGNKTIICVFQFDSQIEGLMPGMGVNVHCTLK